MFAVVVSLEIEAREVARFLPLMQENARRSLADEPACQRFDVCTDPARPGDVLLYELYDTAAAFEAHLATSHFKSFDAATATMVVKKTVRTYTQVAS